MYEGTRCPTPMPVFGGISLFNFGHCSRYIMVSWCGFNLHFPDYKIKNLQFRPYVRKTQSVLLCFSPVCLFYQSHKKLNFWSPNVWGLFSLTKQFSVTPAGCPTVQPNSDALPGDSIRFRGLRERSHGTALTPADAGRGPKLSPCF